MDDDADVLGELSDAPEEPDRETCEALLAELAQLCAAGGWERFARPAVVPGDDAFPDRWEPTPAAIATIVRRLLAHAGVGDLAVAIVDRRAEAAVPGKKVPTVLELVAVDEREARFDLFSIGDDDVPGTLAHEVGAAIAARWQSPDAPYRGVAAHAIDHDARWRGSIAAVYCGLGVLAANAAFQEYKLGTYKAHLGYAPVEYEVVNAGQLTVDELGFLIAVQAIAQDAAPPRGLGGVQVDAVHGWTAALAGRGAAVRALLGMPAPDAWPALERGKPPPLADDPAAAIVIAGGVAPRARRVFRVPASRAGLGVLIGMVVGGVGAGVVGGARGAIPIAIAGGAFAGAFAGSRSRLERCSTCVHVLPAAAPACPHCGGEVAGLITSRADALDAD